MFADRIDAGRQLAEVLRTHSRDEDAIVVGLPRGGVPVAREVADRLGLPLDVIIVRKLGAPHQPELAIGAIGEHGVEVVSEDFVRRLDLGVGELASIVARERRELERRADRYRAGRPASDLRNREVIVVDDGLATGSTAQAACAVARGAGARRIVLAVPVAPSGWERDLVDVADEYVAVATPKPFGAVGNFYVDFSQTSDDAVVECLRSMDPPAGAGDPHADEP